jgi:hypothetical protein
VPARIRSRRTSVIVEEPAKTLMPVNAADTIHRRCAIDQFVTKAVGWIGAVLLVRTSDTSFMRLLPMADAGRGGDVHLWRRPDPQPDFR